MDEKGISVPDYTSFMEVGKTPLYFGKANGKYLGAIAAVDVLKADSKEAVAYLKDLV